MDRAWGTICSTVTLAPGSFHCVAPLGLPHPAVRKKGEWRTGDKSFFARSGSGGISSALILLQTLQNSKILDADDSHLCAPKEKKVTTLSFNP